MNEIEELKKQNAELMDRIGKLEELLVGRTEAVTQQLEQRSRTAAELLSARLRELAETITTSTGKAERAIVQLSANTTDSLGKTTVASAARKMMVPHPVFFQMS